MHADWHFARPLHLMSRFSEPSTRRLLRRSRRASGIQGSAIEICALRIGCAAYLDPSSYVEVDVCRGLAERDAGMGRRSE
ncbi:MAG: hypothetical protein AMJ62_06170 [Myxococcales bacterium SG8_38]|nr:MAG: hypothetical protein AMJ62_06170 [Myxococcales bacterium SG8_38]